MKKTDLTCIGKIINTFGIKGELKVLPITFDNNRFCDLDYIIVEDYGRFQLEKSRIQNSYVYIKLKDFDNINDCLKFKEKFIYIEDKDRIKLPLDHYFISDLIGLSVYDQDSNYIGKVTDIAEYPANDLLYVKGDKEYVIPLVKEFIKSIDDKIIVNLIEGL